MLSREAVGQEEIEDAQGRHIQISLDFIEQQGERIGALLTLRDAESVHRIEDEIELSRRLSAIGRLTSGVAHEVKNPLNAIVVHLEVLRQKMKEIDPDTRRHVDVISSEIQRLDRVVQTLVDFTRPVELRLNDLDMRKLVEDVVSLASPAAEKHQVVIEREVSPDALPVRIDTDLVKQALLNIVLNGVQAMPDGGTLRMTAKRDADSALISVRDQGAGIPENIRDKIFNLYFTTKTGGSGIGLAMAYRVVQMHHGSVEFTSIIDHGTTFYLRFPLAEAAANGDSTRNSKSSSKRGFSQQGMKTLRLNPAAAGVLLLALMTAGCQHKKPVLVMPQQPPPTATPQATPTPADTEAQTRRTAAAGSAANANSGGAAPSRRKDACKNQAQTRAPYGSKEAGREV